MVAQAVWGRQAAGSSPASPTNDWQRRVDKWLSQVFHTHLIGGSIPPPATSGPLAQSSERLSYKEDVGSSILSGATNRHGSQAVRRWVAAP